MERTQLRQILINFFAESELEDLCFDLGVDYEILGGEGKGGKARELIEYMERIGRYDELVNQARQRRPNAPWTDGVALTVTTALTWQTVLQYTGQQGERFLRAAQGSPEQPNIFIPSLYTRRTAVEAQVQSFLESGATALILLGDPGVGKTNLLCQLALDLAADNHGVFYYDCGGSVQLDIEQDVARDLKLESAAQLSTKLKEVSTLAEKEGRHFVLIFDALNEFFQENQVGVGTFLKRIDAFIGRLPEQRVRVILSCRIATWQQMERQNATRLFWQRYFYQEQQPFLRLDPFDQEEFAAIYEAYRTHFGLQVGLQELPAAVRDRLRNPLLLRMMAETYRDRPEVVLPESLLLGIFQRYYEERVQRLPDQLFLTWLVEEMMAQQRIALPLAELASHPQLGPEILKDTVDSSYRRLLDEGVLSEIDGSGVGAKVRFTYDQLGAYALARRLLRQSEGDQAILAVLSQLLHEQQAFPLAWETARIMLYLRRDQALFAEIAQAADVELREVAIHALVEMHADDPAFVSEVVRHLLQMEGMEAQRTGLKAAYYIGPRTRDIFLWAAVQNQPGLRRETKDVLYLIWRNDPDFTFDLLHELTKRIELKSLLNLRLILEFIVDLTITIYINHCEQQELAQQTSDLYYELAIERLHLNLLDTGFLGPAFEKLIFTAISTALAQPILETFYQTEFATPQQLLELTEEDKDRLKRILHLIGPDGELEAAATDLKALLATDVSFHNLLAALALAVNAYHDFAATEPLLKRLFDELNGHGRLWLLQSFAVLLPDTPPEWLGLVEEFTRRLAAENPEVFYAEQTGFLARFDILLLPLGLAYGKRAAGLRDSTMPYFEQLIHEQVAAENWPQVRRVLAGLGPVGFYYPATVLATLQAAITDFTHLEIEKALVAPLCLMRLLHLDEVDIFLQQIEASESLRRRVAAEANVESLGRYIYRLGMYNHTVHSAVHAPKIRRNFIVGGFEVLINTTNPQRFVTYYATTSVRMAREAGYRLIEWTLPDEE